jgi:NADH dehydrogenase
MNDERMNYERMNYERMNSKTAHRVVIIGAGFGGLNAAQALASAPVSITVIDRKNHHTFQPLLYQVATAGLSPGEIAAPIRSILRRHKNVEVLMAEVTGFELERRVVQTVEDGEVQEVPYDSLVVAAGASHAYFGHDEWEALAPGLKTIEDALEIRRRVLLAFELAERHASAGENLAPLDTDSLNHDLLNHDPLNFAVIGGGPTGVELAGTLAEICRHALARDFRSIDPRRARIHLIEGGPHVLPAYPEDLSRSALEQLQRLGVDVLTSTMVTNVEPGAICMTDTAGKTTKMKAAVILWAAGVAASPLGKKLGMPVDRAGRVLVNPDLSLPNHPEVFVIGDLAALKDASGKLLPGVAPVAIQEGRYVARMIRRELASGSESRPEPRPPFHYFDKGSLATIGRSAAIAQFGKIHISGFIAWLAWLFIHILFLIGFQNRVLVFIQWAWSYFTYERSARLITGSTTLPGWSSRASTTPGGREPEEISTVSRK